MIFLISCQLFCFFFCCCWSLLTALNLLLLTMLPPFPCPLLAKCFLPGGPSFRGNETHHHQLADLQPAKYNQLQFAAKTIGISLPSLIDAQVEQVEQALQELFRFNASVLESLVLKQISKLQRTDRLDLALQLACPVSAQKHLEFF